MEQSHVHSNVEGESALEQIFLQSRTILVLFLWMIYTALCGFASTSQLPASEVGQFIYYGLFVVTAFAIVTGFLGVYLKDLRIVTYPVFIVLLALPILAFRQVLEERIVFLMLYYFLLVITPAFLRIWDWRVQTLAGIVAVFAAAFFWFPVGFAQALPSVSIVFGAAVIATYLSYHTSISRLEKPEQAEQESLKILSAITEVELPQRVWAISLLQSVLLVVLIFIEAAWGGGDISSQFRAKVYAFIMVIFGSMLLSIITPALTGMTVVLTTLLVGIVLEFSQAMYVTQDIYRGAIPIILLSFTTVGLPWNYTRQVAIAWGLIVGAVAVKVFPFWQVGLSPFEAYLHSIEVFHAEHLCLIVGLTGSVFASKFIAQRKLTNFAELADRTILSRSSHVRYEEQQFTRFSEAPVLRERTERLIAGLGFLGITSCSYAYAVLFKADERLAVFGISSAFVCITVWLTLFYLRRKISISKQLWHYGTVLGLLLFLWPGIAIIYTGSSFGVWFFWPLCLLIGLGAIPWGVMELIPIVVVSTVASIEIITHLGFGAKMSLLFAVANLAGLLMGVRSGRRLREGMLLGNFHKSLNESKSDREAARILVDYLMSLFDSKSALLSLGRNDLELVRHGKVFNLPPDAWPLSTLREQVSNLEANVNGVGLGTVRWLPHDLRFFDRRFGVFAAEHGLLVELTPTRAHDRAEDLVSSSANENAIGEDTSGSSSANSQITEQTVTGLSHRNSMLLFITTKIPLYDPFKDIELKLANTLSAVTIFRLGMFGERKRKVASEQYFRLTQSEREYELNTLVHDINNTVQDLTVVCDSILEEQDEDSSTEVEKEGGLDNKIKRIALIARSMATVVSDAKRKRELEHWDDLSPKELVSVNNILRDITSFAKVRAERKRIEVEMSELPEDSIWVKVSALEHLETILRNLLNNAITYSDPGSKILVTLRHSDKSVWIDVSDNGPGLTAEECGQIFLPGYRGSSGRKVSGGLGIGLAQSRRVAEAAEGSLEAFSEGPGHGATFTVSLPRRSAETNGGQLHSWALLVDDQPSLTEFYAKISKALQMEPHTAGSVTEAQRVLQQRGKPTLVVTDIHLGAESGLDLVSFLRHEYGDNIPILVVSGLNDDDIEQRARKAGATDFVSKPIGRRALFARIQSLLPGL